METNYTGWTAVNIGGTIHWFRDVYNSPEEHFTAVCKQFPRRTVTVETRHPHDLKSYELVDVVVVE